LFEKYKGENKLFNFGYSNDRSFNKHINIGKALEIPPVDTYTFRHSWATIAQNNCGALDEQIAFCLNHGSAHKVTAGYIKKPIDELNQKVINYILNANIEDEINNKDKAEKSKNQEQLSLFS
jgi:integrase